MILYDIDRAYRKTNLYIAWFNTVVKHFSEYINPDFITYVIGAYNNAK